MFEAGVMLIIKDGLILGISRRNDFTKWGLPGGKRESFDLDIKSTAIRECKEEVDVDIKKCSFLLENFVQPGIDGIGFLTTCYYADIWENEPIAKEEGFNIAWLTMKEISEVKSAFPDFNKKVLEKFKQTFPDIVLL